MMSLGGLLDENRTEEVRTQLCNAMSEGGFAAWMEICANSLEEDIPWQDIWKAITSITCVETYDHGSKSFANSMISSAFVATKACAGQENLAMSGQVNWEELLPNFETSLPRNMKLDILSDILQIYQPDISQPNRILREAEMPGAIIEIDNDRRGALLKIKMSVLSGGSGLFYPDPHAAFLKITNADFTNALGNVAKACGLTRWEGPEGQRASEENSADFDVKWSLYKYDGGRFFDEIGIGGPSLGGAMYTLCRALMIDAEVWNETVTP